MSHATVLVLVHGARSDYVRRNSMPFLTGLAKQGISGVMDSRPGFGHVAALLTGTYPDSSHLVARLTDDVDQGRLGCVMPLGTATNHVRPERTLRRARLAIARFVRSIAQRSDRDPVSAPPSHVTEFPSSNDEHPVDFPGALGAPSLFDLCRSHGLRYRYLAPSKGDDDDAVFEALVRDLRSGSPCDLYVARLNVLERNGHRHGPFDSALQVTHLRALDQKLASIHAALAAGYDSWDLMVVGDHGMAPVERHVDVAKALSRSGAREAKDYAVLVRSTFALIWYLTAIGEKAIEAMLPAVAGTRVVGPDERRSLRMPSGPRWGHTMLAADPGVVFWPDFARSKKRRIRGVHGYVNKVSEHHGTIILRMSDGEATPRTVGLRPLVDVFPTLCDLLNVRVPAGQEGESLVGLVRMHPPNRATPALAAAPSQGNQHA